MAGGIGSRFWPISRNSMPKQFLDILGTGRSFLQETFDRFSNIIPKENILVVTSEKYGEKVKEQLPEMPYENILLEPHKRNTAPCIAYATYKLSKKNPNATVVVTPSDHVIMNEKTFLDTVSDAMNYASTNDNLYTLGIKPTRPETAYGYIQKNSNNFQNINGRPTYSVKTFTEKPSEELAKELINSGEFLWNSGIFIWNLKAIITELEKYLPDIAFLFKKGIPLYYTPNETSFIKSVYEECTGISIDYGVMEKTDKSWVFESSFGWSDLGTWHSLYAYSKKDEQNNMVNAQKVMINQVTNSLIVSKEKNKLIVINGLEDYMVVNTDDVLMICPRNEKNIKNILTDLALNDLTDFQ